VRAVVTQEEEEASYLKKKTTMIGERGNVFGLWRGEFRVSKKLRKSPIGYFLLQTKPNWVLIRHYDQVKTVIIVLRLLWCPEAR